MVNLETIQGHITHFEENVGSWYNSGKRGRYVLIEGEGSDISVRFFRTELGLRRASKKETFLVEQVPKKTHRFQEGNIGFETRPDEIVEHCPNDGRTALEIKLYDVSPTKKTETAECLDCGYTVRRKISDKGLERRQKDYSKLVSYLLGEKPLTF